MKQYHKKYIGEKKISDIKLSELKTLMGKEVYEVRFYDNTMDLLPGDVIKRVATKKPTDLSELRDLMVRPVAEKMLALMAEADLTLENVQYAIRLLDSSVEDNIKRVIVKLWGKDYPQRTMMDIERILATKENEQNTNTKT